MTTSEALYRSLLDQAPHPRTQRNLKNVWEALEHMRKIDTTDFSYKNVADTIQALAQARGQKKGSPAYSSIRNDPADRFKPLIDAYRSEHVASAEEATSPPDSLSELIPDRHTAASVRRLEAENRALKKRVNLLKNGFRELSLGERATGSEDVVGQASLAGSTDSDQITAGTRANQGLTPDEMKALEKFLRVMEEAGLSLTERGSLRLTTPGGNTFDLVGPAFGQAIWKLVDDR